MELRQHPADRETDHYLAIETAHAQKTAPARLCLMLLCAAFLVIFGLLLCFLPHRDFSPEENRPLTGAPALSGASVLDGSFMTGITDFCADQFPLRSFFIQLKAGCEQLLGKCENNGVLAGNDNYLISRQEYGEGGRAAMQNNLTAIRKLEDALSARGISFYAAFVPRSVDVNVAQLPMLYDPLYAHAARSELLAAAREMGVSLTDLTDPLRQAADVGQAVWYRTDHHWTAEGAYVAYESLADLLGYTPYGRDAFTAETVRADFYGTTHASSGMLYTPGEPLTLLRYEGDDAFVTEILEGGRVVRTLQGLYDFDAAQTHDEYNVFLGGTNTQIRIRCLGREDAPTLVLLKDSFSQSLAPFLARHFDLLLIDPRTYDFRVSGSVIDLIEEQAPTAVLLLYGIDTLYDSYSLKNMTYGLH